jgi:hypothetical protein
MKFGNFQWSGQFFISTSDLTPEIPGGRREDSNLFHPSAKFTALSDV